MLLTVEIASLKYSADVEEIFTDRPVAPVLIIWKFVKRCCSTEAQWYRFMKALFCIMSKETQHLNRDTYICSSLFFTRRKFIVHVFQEKNVMEWNCVATVVKRGVYYTMLDFTLP